MSSKNLKNDSSSSQNEDEDKPDGYEAKESKVFGEAMQLPVKDHLQKLEVRTSYPIIFKIAVMFFFAFCLW